MSSIATSDFVYAGNPIYITANAGVVGWDIVNNIKYQQKAIPYGTRWVVLEKNAYFNGGSGGGVWGDITGTLSNQTDLQAALDAKENSLGFTPENIANKSTSTALGTSNTLYPSQGAVKGYVDNAITSISRQYDGGKANSIYLISQSINGGHA